MTTVPTVPTTADAAPRRPVRHVLLGVVFLAAGASKLAGAPRQVDEFDRYRYPQRMRLVTGAVEVTGAAAALAGVRYPSVGRLGAAVLAATMVGALATHARVQDPPRRLVPAGVLLGIAASVVVRRSPATPSAAGTPVTSGRPGA